MQNDKTKSEAWYNSTYADMEFFLDKLSNNNYLRGQITQLRNLTANIINKLKLKLIQKQPEDN